MAHSPGFLDDEQIDAAGAAGPSLPSPVMGYQSNLERIDLGRDFAVGIVPRPRNYSGSAGDPEGLWKLASRKLAGLVPEKRATGIYRTGCKGTGTVLITA